MVQIDGVSALHALDHRIIPDRIEAGSFIIAAALSGGEVYVKGARADHLEAFLIKLREAGVIWNGDDGGIHVRGGSRIKSVDVKTLPYPGFPTDLQAQMMVLMAVADGVSVITETIFENRFMHVPERLDRIGADVELEGDRAVVRGVARTVRRAGDGKRLTRQRGAGACRPSGPRAHRSCPRLPPRSRLRTA